MADKELNESLRDLESGPRTSEAPGDGPRGAAADASAHPSVAALRAKFGDAVQHHTVMAGDEHVVYIARERIREVLRWLKDDAAHDYKFLIDVTAVDYGGGRPLEVVYQLWSLTHGRQLRLKVTLPLSALEVDSAVPVWNSANWLEREVYDLFGIHFHGHPDLRRIMMPDNYAEGHPLRKDFPLRGRFSRAEQTRRAMEMDLEDFYIPAELATAGMKEAAPKSPAGASGASAAAAPEPGGIRTPNDPDHWSLGSEDSGAGGASAPEGVDG